MTQVNTATPILMNCLPQNGKLVCTPVDSSTKAAVAVPVAQDELKIQKGLKATGKGLLVGGGTGAASGAVLAGVLSHTMTGIYGDMTVGNASIVGSITGGVTGGIAGAIAANFTDNKVVAGAVGGVVGGVATGIMGLGWLPGLVTGAIGGVTGSTMAQRK